MAGAPTKPTDIQARLRQGADLVPQLAMRGLDSLATKLQSGLDSVTSALQGPQRAQERLLFDVLNPIVQQPRSWEEFNSLFRESPLGRANQQMMAARGVLHAAPVMASDAVKAFRTAGAAKGAGAAPSMEPEAARILRGEPMPRRPRIVGIENQPQIVQDFANSGGMSTVYDWINTPGPITVISRQAPNGKYMVGLQSPHDFIPVAEELESARDAAHLNVWLEDFLYGGRNPNYTPPRTLEGFIEGSSGEYLPDTAPGARLGPSSARQAATEEYDFDAVDSLINEAEQMLQSLSQRRK